MEIIDLDNLAFEHNQELNQIASEIRQDYNDLVEAVSNGHIDNINWIVSSIASRNKYHSPLFIRCCRIAFIQTLLQRPFKISEIVLADRALANLLTVYMHEQGHAIRVRCTEKSVSMVWRLFRPFRQYAIAFSLLFLRSLGRSKPQYIQKTSASPITLVDTFVLNNGSGDEGSINNGHYKDRYYPGMMEHLTDDERKNIFYLPTIVGFNNPINAFRLIRKAQAPFLIHDDFLNLSDYFFALKHPFKLLACDISQVNFRGINVTNILKEERFNHCSDIISILGVLYYRFAYRLAKSGVRVRLLVDWYENQVIDRGMIVGFHRFHPETKVIGYQGYVISKNLHLYVYPNSTEFLGQAVPDIVYVVGEGLKDDLHEFCKDVVVEVGPAYRFHKLWRDRLHTPEAGFFTILIGLPISLDDSLLILRLVARGITDLQDEKWRFWIKPHPTWGPDRIRGLLSEDWPERFIFQTGDFHEVIEKSNLLISNASSVSLEALAKGIPAIVIGSTTGITQCPIPDSIPKVAWNIIYNEAELVSEIKRFEAVNNVQNTYFKKLGIEIREKFFNPASRKNTLSFLELM